MDKCWGDLNSVERIRKKRETKSSQFKYVKISKNGQVSFSNAFCESIKHQIEYSDRILIQISSSNKAVVFKFINSDDKWDAPSWAFTKKNGWYGIQSKSFNHVFMNHEGCYLPVLEDIPHLGECWVIYLDNPIFRLSDKINKFGEYVSQDDN